MPSVEELVAHDRNIEEISEELGADWLIYQDLDDLIAAVDIQDNVDRFDTSCFDADYVTGDIDAKYLSDLHAARNDQSKQNLEKSNEIIELHNTN